MEMVEMYDQLQEERLDSLQDDLVTCISGAEGNGGKLSTGTEGHGGKVSAEGHGGKMSVV
jgi:hypothetical protein